MLRLDKTSLVDGAFKAKKQIEAASMIPVTKDISFTAGNNIVLLPGFEVKNSAIFTANIADCLQAAFAENKEQSKKIAKNTTDTTALVANNTETAKLKEIIFRLTKPAQIKLSLKDVNDKTIVLLIDHYSENIGTQTKFLPTNKLAKGIYWIELEVDSKVLREQVLID